MMISSAGRMPESSGLINVRTSAVYSQMARGTPQNAFKQRRPAEEKSVAELPPAFLPFYSLLMHKFHAVKQPLVV